jgi:hypothetical protein
MKLSAHSIDIVDKYILSKNYERAERVAKLFRAICPPDLFHVVINKDGRVRAKPLTKKFK